jgi:VCBS repeat-containing protein
LDDGYGVLAWDSPPNQGEVQVGGGPSQGTLDMDEATGHFSYDPNDAFAGLDQFQYSFTVTIQDPNGDPYENESNTTSVKLHVINEAPGATDDGPETLPEDGSVSVPASAGVLVNDVDNEEDPFTASLVLGPAHGQLSLAADGSFTYTPDENYSGPDSFVYRVSDGLPLYLGEDWDTMFFNDRGQYGIVALSVAGSQDAPNAVDDTYSTNEDTQLSIAAPGVLANDTDPDGDPLSVSSASTTSAKGATVSVQANGSFLYDPRSAAILQAMGASQSLVDTFTYTISDGYGGSDTATVSVTVTGVAGDTGENGPPDAVNDSYTTNEDELLEVDAPGVLGNDTDPDSDLLTVTTASATSAKGAAVAVNPNGSFEYDPRESETLRALGDGETTVDTFTYTISDGRGGSDTATVSVTVTGVISYYPNAVDDEYESDENALLTVAAPGVLANDLDPNGDGITVTSASTVSQMGAVVSVQPDGSFTYDPRGSAALQALRGGQSIIDTFTYTMSDDSVSDSATVFITVFGVNYPPTAVDDSYETNEDTPLTVAAPGLLANDSDPDLDSLWVSSASTTSEQGAAVTVNADGSFTYDPSESEELRSLAGGETTVDTFSYTIDDGHGGSDTATVWVTVTGVNRAPDAVADAYETDEDTLLSVPAPGLLANDTDPDQDTLTVNAITTVSQKGAEVLIYSDGSFEYDPRVSDELQGLSAGESTVDTFSYSIHDGHGGNDTATVSVTVHGVNDAPTAEDDSYSTSPWEVFTVSPGEALLANDSDPDGDVLAVTTAGTFASSEGATVVLQSNGIFTYDPITSGTLAALGENERIIDWFD